MKKSKISISEQVAELERDREWLYNQNVALRAEQAFCNRYFVYTLIAVALIGWGTAIFITII